MVEKIDSPNGDWNITFARNGVEDSDASIALLELLQVLTKFRSLAGGGGTHEQVVATTVVLLKAYDKWEETTRE
ncbi:MAG: hypothetical protein KKC50_08145 [Candidatus Omnitrophica bacterium]|nr:hypothetical protein [Candidatus Omnitrophota bacterium]MBU1657393.1 hypothetical protein [Candidatus Omnitrophota bacterium]